MITKKSSIVWILQYTYFMNKEKETNKTNHYVHSTITVLVSVVVGFILQFILGGIPKEWFVFPTNVFLGLAFVFISTAVFFFGRNTDYVKIHSGTSFAIVTTTALGILTVGLGSINIDVASGKSPDILVKLGLGDITATWYFGLVYLMTINSLWFAILKRLTTGGIGNITFLLNHFGIWLILFAGVLGKGDIVRMKMELKKDQPEWRAVGDDGSIVELPIALELKQFTIDIYPNKLFVIDTSGTALPIGGKPVGFMLEKEGESMVLSDWKITLHKYLQNAIPENDSTYVSHPMWGNACAALVSVENVNTGEIQKSWISAGNFQFPPKAIKLDDNHNLVMSPAEARKFESDVLVYQKDNKEIKREKIEVNHPIEIDGWKVYQVSYDERMGRWSELSVVELILDPWLPVVYIGIFILILGGVAFLFKSRK